MLVASFPGLGLWVELKVGSELNISIHLSVFSNYRYNMISCLMTMPQCSPHHSGHNIPVVSHSQPILPSMDGFYQALCHSHKTVTNNTMTFLCMQVVCFDGTYFLCHPFPVPFPFPYS